MIYKGNLAPEILGLSFQEESAVTSAPNELKRELKGFLKKINPNRPAAFILGGGSTNGLAFVRSLGRKGIPVAAVDTSSRAAMRSRYGFNLDHSWGREGEPALLDLMERIGQKLPSKGVIIPTGDAYVLFTSRNRQQLGNYYDFVLSEESTLEKLANKKFQYLAAEAAGVPIPETYYLDRPGSIEDVAGRVSYPCIIKPVYSHLWRQYVQKVGVFNSGKVIVCPSPEEFINHFTRVADSGIEWVVQERIGGNDDQLYALYAYFNRASQPLAVFVRRKVRQWPVDFGTGSFSVGVLQEEVVASGVKFLQGLGYQGLTNTEFKLDPKDGQFKLIEVNVRSASQSSLAVDSGVDLPYIAYQDALGHELEPVESYRLGVRWINLGADFKSYRVYNQRKQLGFWSWLMSV